MSPAMTSFSVDIIKLSLKLYLEKSSKTTVSYYTRFKVTF